jgi:serine/threonine protein kinase/tetratricopeptide (TPR) repeat protein
VSRDRAFRLEKIFCQALELPRDEREAFLRDACVGDDALFEQVHELLAADEKTGDFLEDLAEDVRSATALEIETAARPRLQLGPYQAEEAIGRGGMGVVYRAVRVDGGFEQQVALKLLHLDMQTPEMRARFFAERQLLARLEHRNIARLLDGGVTDEGRPFFVMELVSGRPVTTFCSDQQLSLDDVLRLFLQVIDAVSYLHRNLVVHRDLKPSNLMVRDDGTVKLLDFGIAKLLADESDMAATVTGGRLLTPQYAAPEQFAGGTITTATDVYSLGAVLYELVAGRPVHAADPSTGASRPEVRTAPSEDVRRRREDSDGEASRWARIPRDLDNICLKALRTEPERRYASAEQMGRDIQHLLDGRPVSASADTFGYRLSKRLRRHWRPAAVACGVLVLSGMFLVRERSLRDQAELAAARAEAVSAFLGDLFTSADPARAQGRDVTVRDVLGRADEQLDEGAGFRGGADVEAEVRLVLGRTYLALGRIQEGTRQLEAALELAGGWESDSRVALAAVEALADAGRLEPDERVAVMRRVAAVRAERLGEDHRATLSARGGLASALLAQRRFEEAEALDRQVLETWTRVYGRDDPGTLKAANRLGAVLFGTARYDEAAGIYRPTLEISRRVRGDSHPETLRLIANLGTTYSVLGRYAEAEPLQREVVAEHVRVLGDEHPRAGMSMHNLGSLMLHLGRFDEAEMWFRRAVAARDAAGPAGYLFSQSHLADSLRNLGRFDEARALYEETLRLQRSMLDEDHPDTFRTQAGLAELLRRTGGLDEAEGLAREALEDQRRVRGEKHLNAADTLLILSRIQASRGMFDDARALADEAVTIRRAVFPDRHPLVLAARLAVVDVRCAAGEAAPARPELEALADDLGEVLGAEHPTNEEARRLLASCPSPQRVSVEND